MRACVREVDHPIRLRGMLDPAPAIRRAAIHATADAGATDAKDLGEDLDALFDVARLDPEPLVRTDAVRAIAKLAASSADAGVTGRLRDLWVSADEPLREDIAAAWAVPAVCAAGGRHELAMLFAQQTGPAVLAAAGAVLASADRDDAELAASAIAVLGRAIKSGPDADRLHAVAIAPLSSVFLLEALRKAAKDDSPAVRVAVLSRLAESKDDRTVALSSLEALAQSDGSATRARARFALAAVGDARVQGWLVTDLADKDPEVRVSAARGLAGLGVAGRAAALLADPDASVRTRAACAVLAAVRGAR
jgi:hypothetical protein